MKVKKEHLTVRLSPDVLQIIQNRATNSEECATSRSPQTAALEQIVRESTTGKLELPAETLLAERERDAARLLIAATYEARGVDTGKMNLTDLVSRAIADLERLEKAANRQAERRGPELGKRIDPDGHDRPLKKSGFSDGKCRRHGFPVCVPCGHNAGG